MNELRSQIYEFDRFRVDASKRLLTKGDSEALPLTPKVFDTLLYLVRHNDKVIEKDELMREIWTDSIVEENNLNQNISILRRVFGEKPGEHRFIVTIAGHGYRFVPDVKIVDGGEGPELPTETGYPTPVESKENLPVSGPHAKNRTNIPLYVFVGILALSLVATALYYWKNSKTAVSGSGIRTIAVLPFKSLTAENRNEALELGMADSLISKLGSDDVLVRPLGSVTRYVGLDQNDLNAGRDLEVEAVLDGTIQTSGDRVRVSANLLRVGDGKQLWTGQFDEKFTDIFAVQDSISEKVATALKIKLGDNHKKHYTQNVEAYQLYMKGRFHVFKAIKSEALTGVTYFQQAIDADPNYALAYAGLADAYRGLGVGGETPRDEFFPRAKAAANRAVELDDSLAEAHAVLGLVIFWYDWDWDAAEIQFTRAIELDPNSPDALQYYANFLSCMGRHAEALAKIKYAREIDPLSLRINVLEGLYLLHAGQTDEAIARFEKTLELDPNYRLANSFIARAYIEKGMFDQAVAASRKAQELSALNSSEQVAFAAVALARSGKIAEARTALDELLKLSKERFVPPYNIALIYNALGEQRKALDYLEKGLAEKDVRMVFLKVEPKWSNLRSEPRFVELIKQMNL
jgi:DNA-binding winged helix-turn-helix (wHTH) protein/TolB-like protein/cytochrome c-type biogenesis protein CcmH/NrfG